MLTIKPYIFPYKYHLCTVFKLSKLILSLADGFYQRRYSSFMWIVIIVKVSMTMSRQKSLFSVLILSSYTLSLQNIRKMKTAKIFLSIIIFKVMLIRRNILIVVPNNISILCVSYILLDRATGNKSIKFQNSYLEKTWQELHTWVEGFLKELVYLSCFSLLLRWWCDRHWWQLAH